MLKPAMDIVSESWHLSTKNWRNLLPYLTILFLPALALAVLGIASLYLSMYFPQTSMVTNLLITVVSAAGFVLNIWASIAITKALANFIMGQPINWKENFTSSNNLIWPIISSSILFGLIVFGGSFLLLIPGIIFWGWYNLFTYPVIFEGARGMAALRSSKTLIAGRWWSMAWRVIFPTIAFGFLNIIIVLALIILIKTLPLSPFGEMTATTLFSSLVGTLTTPFFIGATLILYQNAKQTPIACEKVPTL